MAGDHKTVTDIPAVFLYSKEGNILRTCIDAGEAEQRLPLEILIGTEAKSLGADTSHIQSFTFIKPYL